MRLSKLASEIAESPTFALNDWLVTTIASGAGTQTLSLTNPAISPVASEVVQHDDTVGVNAWIAALKGLGPALLAPSVSRTMICGAY